MRADARAGDVEYFAYLRRRSRIGLAYRSFWLYPRLSRHLDGRTIDFGCGIGDFLAHRPDTVGVDVNRACVDYCCRRGLTAVAIEGGRAPFADASFDSAVLDNVLEHLTEPDLALNELRRLLRPGGVLVIGVPMERGFAVDPDHKVFYNCHRLVATAGRFGFVAERLFRMPLAWPVFDRLLTQQCLYGRFVHD